MSDRCLLRFFRENTHCRGKRRIKQGFELIATDLANECGWSGVRKLMTSMNTNLMQIQQDEGPGKVVGPSLSYRQCLIVTFAELVRAGPETRMLKNWPNERCRAENS
jgi:hypothetical protein